MSREFSFLPELPKPKLDDREFKDLVDECKLRIPRYCPEWTNYNPSDPGVTLIELFAWLTEQMLLRFNEVPRLNYVTFLELLGISLQAPTPAKCEVTFYLSTSLPEPQNILAGTEVATERTENEEAIIFATDKNLVVTQPEIKHLLTATETQLTPQVLRDPFSSHWRKEQNGEWAGSRATNLFAEQPQEGNCFYIALEPNEIEGNVIVLTIKASAATSTGISPENPPRQWEAWNGEKWESILLKATDDATEGFSFSRFEKEGGVPSETGADITLHLPLNLPVTNFATYQGRWLRCSYTKQGKPNQDGYASSPRITAIAVRSIGGSVKATQSTRIENEILGESDGNPGQSFYLQRTPILPRKKENEYIQVTTPGGITENWQEVENFGDSGENDPHYTIDSITGRVQFGPLIREPAQIKESTQLRQRLQGSMAARGIEPEESQKRQYGQVPPRGSTIKIVAYRTGGGKTGNVEKGTIKIVKTAVPYIDRVENHKPARGGNDAESLDAAVIRVPQLLRTPNRAVTAEDFETLAMRAAGGAILRARCLQPHESGAEAGTVRLLLVPNPNQEDIEQGIAPDRFHLTPDLQAEIKAYLDERRLLGVKVIYSQPEYIGVSVQTQVALEPGLTAFKKEELKQQLLIALYRFLNPISGGFDGKGWPFNRAVYNSDIIKLIQTIRGVQHIGTIKLYAIRFNPRSSRWERSEPRTEINLGPLGLICSWHSPELDSGHKIYVD
ncbi:putative baseplate assembly protein [Anabaena sp. UHCC 0204]|uniref:putative baseplate assembly protein n=1 Tax=Anabaena sp. UHCC 0204 TaxID=2590009 RepID=UPI001444C1B1|nr:putative baseplate assembly protein [Anabaena sp. UHCC 0204]MTJ08126.1 putative baseplate assembly protein [Anabaena sp. UHCC 0204]